MKKRPIYHITHVENLPSIIAENRLWCDAKRNIRKLSTTNIGHKHIKERRLKRKVGLAANGVLGDYVPFNFCNRSVMLYVIHADSVEGYSEGQGPIVHLVSTVGRAIATGRPWAFTNRHAELGYAEYFDSIDQEDKVDWSVMRKKYWAGSDETKETRQAEFLVHDWFPWTGIRSIGVKSEQTKRRVEQILQGCEHSPDVILKPSWYY